MITISKDQVREPLYCIVSLFNPWRWKSRWKHTERAIKHFVDSGAVVILVEIAYNRRELVMENSGLHNLLASCGIQGEGFRHQYIGLRTKEELWLKENSINVGIQALPDDWKQVCWLDSDVHFIRPNWVGECIHKLQHYSFLQMFSQARDLGPNYEMLPETYPHANGVSFVQSWKDGDLEVNLTQGWKKVKQDLASLKKDLTQVETDLQILVNDIDEYYNPQGPRRVFPGLAWAATRDAYDKMGGLIDFAIWGGGDWHMAHALVNRTDGMMHTALHRNYKQMVSEWHQRAEKEIRRNVGTMEGAIFHSWHGKKTSRGYGEKHRILARLGFNPLRHLKRDFQGLWQLHDDGSEEFIGLRDSFREIAKERNEDSIDI